MEIKKLYNFNFNIKHKHEVALLCIITSNQESLIPFYKCQKRCGFISSKRTFLICLSDRWICRCGRCEKSRLERYSCSILSFDGSFWTTFSVNGFCRLMFSFMKVVIQPVGNVHLFGCSHRKRFQCHLSGILVLVQRDVSWTRTCRACQSLDMFSLSFVRQPLISVSHESVTFSLSSPI